MRQVLGLVILAFVVVLGVGLRVFYWWGEFTEGYFIKHYWPLVACMVLTGIIGAVLIASGENT